MQRSAATCYTLLQSQASQSLPRSKIMCLVFMRFSCRIVLCIFVKEKPQKPKKKNPGYVYWEDEAKQSDVYIYVKPVFL